MALEFSFEYDDESARRAVREGLAADAARALDAKAILAIVVGTGLHVWALATPTSPLWWRAFSGLVPVLTLFAGLALVWAWARLPAAAARRLARLPHRRVDVALDEAWFRVATANERMELAWVEISELIDLPNFVLVGTRQGERLPLPKSALGAAGERELRLRAGRPSPGPEGPPPA